MRRKPRYISAERKAQVERFKDAMRRFDAEDERRARSGFSKAKYPLTDWRKAFAQLKLTHSQEQRLMEGGVCDGASFGIVPVPEPVKTSPVGKILSFFDVRWLSR